MPTSLLRRCGMVRHRGDTSQFIPEGVVLPKCDDQVRILRFGCPRAVGICPDRRAVSSARQRAVCLGPSSGLRRFAGAGRPAGCLFQDPGGRAGRGQNEECDFLIENTPEGRSATMSPDDYDAYLASHLMGTKGFRFMWPILGSCPERWAAGAKSTGSMFAYSRISTAGRAGHAGP